jgi:hypothetical protein
MNLRSNGEHLFVCNCSETSILSNVWSINEQRLWSCVDLYKISLKISFHFIATTSLLQWIISLRVSIYSLDIHHNSRRINNATEGTHSMQNILNTLSPNSAVYISKHILLIFVMVISDLSIHNTQLNLKFRSSECNSHLKNNIFSIYRLHSLLRLFQRISFRKRLAPSSVLFPGTSYTS